MMMSIDKVGYAMPPQPVGASPVTPSKPAVAVKEHSDPSDHAVMQSDSHVKASVDKAVSMANERMAMAETSVRFSKDEESGRTVIKMIDQTTNQVIRQFPSEEMLRITHALDKLQGIALNRKA